MFTYIYALLDPRVEEVRYVGKSDDPDLRYIQHLSDSGGTWKARWVRYLKTKGLRPVLKILEEVREEEWEEAERRWISYYRENGCSLTNLTDGGNHFSFDLSVCIDISEKKTKRCIIRAEDYCDIIWDTSLQRWVATLHMGEEEISIGSFYCRGDAIDRYDYLAENVYSLPTFVDLRTENDYRIRGENSSRYTQKGRPKNNHKNIFLCDRK